MPRFLAIFSLLTLLPAATIFALEPSEKGGKMNQNESSAASLLQEADSVFQQRAYDKALEMYKKVAETARSEFNNSVEVEALSQMARMNLILGNHADGRSFLDEAKAKVSDSDPMGWSRYLGVKGRFEWKADSLEAAKKTFDDMYTYCNVNALYGRAVDAAHMVAIVSTDLNEQIEWAQKGIKAAEASESEQWLGPLWNNLGVTYHEHKMFDSALTAFEKAREYHWRFSGEVAKLFADYHVGMTYRLLGKLDEAGQWLRPVLAWAERIENHSAIGQACEDLGEIEIARGNKAEGLKFLKRARDEYKAAGFDQSWEEIWSSINKRITELESMN